MSRDRRSQGARPWLRPRSSTARVVAAARRAVDAFPLTSLGVVVISGASIALLHYGIDRLDLVLLVVGGAFIALTGLSLLAVVSTSIGLWAHLRRRTAATEAVEVECGHPHRTGFSLGVVRWLPFVDVTWTWVEPPAELRITVDRGRLIEEVTGQRRGVVAGVVRRMVVRDSFGLCAIAWTWRDDQPLRFVPTVGALRTIEVIRGMSAGEELPHPEAPAEGGPFDMRHYAPGDPIRFVLWKVFAKSRELLVRTPERALEPARQTAAYLVTSRADEAAAGAARLAVAAGVLGTGWSLGADGCPEPATTPGMALDVLTRSASTPEDRGGNDLAEFLSHHASRDTSRLVVFVPGRPGPWLGPVAAAVRSHGARLELVIGVDGISRVRPRGLERLLRRADGTTAATGETEVLVTELQEVLHALRGATVTVVDRRAGQIFTADHLRAMEAA
ncbi:DUF58 domain-containing protein [Paraliomyxa miuraensis]|uniref:DUF58 domain-containing protein n=1 Tax=Paraliomyxa miuraensis TaxID=376150 RepID=UPI00224EFD87|nr:DUF58 domain-containing protein [Paraliomyxa miuraensis]MCX4245518.1 DUF58 domain-containing protein [Paraliomyxa miuraensis]